MKDLNHDESSGDVDFSQHATCNYANCCALRFFINILTISADIRGPANTKPLSFNP